MPRPSLSLRLTAPDTRALEQLLHRGVQPVRVVVRGLALLALHRGESAPTVAVAVLLSPQAVRNIAARYRTAGNAAAPSRRSLKMTKTPFTASSPVSTSTARWAVLVGDRILRRDQQSSGTKPPIAVSLSALAVTAATCAPDRPCGDSNAAMTRETAAGELPTRNKTALVDAVLAPRLTARTIPPVSTRPGTAQTFDSP